MKIKTDLHMHTALSPCGSLDMSPSAVVAQARACGLDVISITDHNAVKNSFYVAEAAKKIGLTVIYGMEAQTIEDVHLLCYFPQRRQVELFYQDIYPLLPDIKNNPEFFGDQVFVDTEDNVLGFEEKVLLNSLDLAIGDLVERVRLCNGYVVPAHVDSEKFGLMINMGVVPPELNDCAMEISYNLPPAKLFNAFPQLREFPMITNSDAHYLDSIGRAYCIYDVRPGVPLLEGIFSAVKEGRFDIYRREALKQP